MSEQDNLGPYEVHTSSELGRYLVATKDIEAREIIIREEPLMSGPSDRGPKDIPACLGCGCVMDIEPWNRCTSCHWPVCDESCEKLPPHASNECQIFSRNHVIYPPPNGSPIVNKSIFILRCLLLRNSEESSSSSSAWNQLMSMSDNKEIRSAKPLCINADRKIVENFRKFFPHDDGDGFSEEEIVRISGIIDTNAHAFPLRVNETLTSICNLYSKTSLMAHSCTPNASWSPDKSLSSLTLTIRANIPIRKGDMICVAYDEGQLLVSTLQRLLPSEIHGMFTCRCKRCLDPTELGTYIGALKCPSCEQGYLLPEDPVDSFSAWKCDKCDLELDDETVMELIEDAESTCGYSKMDFCTSSSSAQECDEESLELLKEFVGDYSGVVLHPNHYILQEVNVRILKGEHAKGLSKLEESELIQYLERCDALLQLSDILTPGFCEYRAFLQFHFCQGLLSLQKRRGRAGKKNKAKGKTKMSPEQSARIKGNSVETDGNCSEQGTSSSSHVVPSSQLDSPTKYGNRVENLRKLLGMLLFLQTYFSELNSSHKLLEPITDTIEETRHTLKLLEEKSK